MLLNKKDNTFGKAERLCSEKRIGALFTSSSSFIAYPLRVVYLLREPETEPQVSVLITVPKKKFKRAVKRNRIKRLIREAYRLNKSSYIELSEALNKSVDIAFLYLDTELPGYEDIEKAVLKASVLLKDKLSVETE
ncbi:ribonuclease P protein component [Dysgonomonas sp. 520]|nr:ribonuclease P protein component [Dysgonomonas sp. 520]